MEGIFKELCFAGFLPAPHAVRYVFEHDDDEVVGESMGKRFLPFSRIQAMRQ
jgi:hypothetical protein